LLEKSPGLFSGKSLSICNINLSPSLILSIRQISPSKEIFSWIGSTGCVSLPK
jgi:hypothetical protein